jgi:hypothetical protein
MKRLILTLIAAFGLVAAVPAAAFAYGGPETNPTACPGGKMVVNVTYEVTNDLDSAVGGQNWANDTLNRHLQVWQVGSDQYCAQLSDNGSFVTLGSVDPATGTPGALDAGISGVINGGYTTGVYSSSFSSSDYATKGHLGTFDANAAHPSILSYTPQWPYSQPYWGWSYHTAKNGDWVNASAGNSGDITNN